MRKPSELCGLLTVWCGVCLVAPERHHSSVFLVFTLSRFVCSSPSAGPLSRRHRYVHISAAKSAQMVDPRGVHFSTTKTNWWVSVPKFLLLQRLPRVTSLPSCRFTAAQKRSSAPDRNETWAAEVVGSTEQPRSVQQLAPDAAS